MDFISEKEITANIAMQDGYMPQIDIDRQATKKLVQKIGEKGLDDSALNALNVLGQHITRLDTSDYSYEHLGNRLQFSELSRGEKVFLVSLASKYTGMDLYLQHDILQLTKTNLRQYYQMFRECDFIHIIYGGEEIKNYLECAMRGEIR